MTGLINFPDIGPDIFSIDVGGFAFSLRWYAVAYIVGIIIGWRIAVRAVRAHRLWPENTPPAEPSQVEELLTSVIIGVVLGGRLGYVFFYQPAYYLQNPIEIPMIWQGGMSFHGGMIGVVVAAVIYCWRKALPLLSIADMMAISTAPGLLLGRIANFINAELWGRPTDVAWGVAFPGAAAQECVGVVGLCARHPSQIYEAMLEGLILGCILLYLAWGRGWLKKPGQITGMFGFGYGLSRYVVEYFREADALFITPDNPLGHVIDLGPLGMSMGQVLSLPMIILGLAMIVWSRKRA